MKIAIYSGVSPSTTFIERLIVGISESNNQILLVGRKNKEIAYNSNVINATYKNDFILLLFILKYYLPLSIEHKRLVRSQIKLRSSLKVKLKKLAEISLVLFHKPDIFHVQWAKSIEEWIFLKETCIKVIVSLRGAHINYSPIIDEYLGKMYRNIFPLMDGFHGVSQAIIEEARKYNLNISNFKVVYSGLDLDKFEYKEKIISQGKINILSIGRSHWIKAYPFAIDVLSEFLKFNSNIHYKIIGGNTEETLFQINQLNVGKNIELLGNLPFEEVKSNLYKADVFLLPSYEEGIANVVLEAMALGILVISSDCGGMSEVIEDGVNGFLFENRSKESLLSKLMLVSQFKNEDYQRITKNARQTIEERFTEEIMVESMLELYSHALATF
jgi:colanic acid/amylovoran biosynthesis glycosyltransferase